MKFPPEIIKELKNYVYIYRDPDTSVIFYIGRGQGNRAFSHINDSSETRKTEIIRRLRKSGKMPIVDILRYGLTDDNAALVEAAAIDLIGMIQLTNQARGFHDSSSGRISAKSLIETAKAKDCRIIHKALLIRINQLYREDMTKQELYEATRGVWPLNLNRCQKSEYAFAVYQGIVREVFQIHSWHPAGTTSYETRQNLSVDGRVEFLGSQAPENIRKQYIGKSVRRPYLKKGNRRPVVYVNI
jgi:hypothetical protein